MDRLYKARSAERRQQIDATVRVTSEYDMKIARGALAAVFNGRYYDFEDLRENHPAANRIFELFVSDRDPLATVSAT